jgi:5-methylcytosine-specific restriction endonuclease McrA
LIDFDPFHPICFQCGSPMNTQGGTKAGCAKCNGTARKRRYRESHREKLRASNRIYRAENLEQVREAGLRHYYKKRDHYQEYGRAYYANNRERRAEYAKQYQKDNPEVYQAMSARRRTRIETGMTAEDRATSVEWRRFLRYCPCYYCGEFAEVTHVDHMLPLSRGGTDHWFNLQQSCRSCNLSKHTKTAEEFMAVKYAAHAPKWAT